MTDEYKGYPRQPVEPLRGLVSGIGSVFSARFPRDVPRTLKTGRRRSATPSTLRVVAASIAPSRRDACLDVPTHHGVARLVPDELTQDDALVPSMALRLDLERYPANRKTVPQPRWGRGGRMERTASARKRGEVDIAMIGVVSSDMTKLLLPIRRGAGEI